MTDNDSDSTVHEHPEGVPLPECIDGTRAPRTAEEACEIATGEVRHLSIFDRYLSIWVALCIIVGTLIGYFIPSTARVLDKASTARISWPIAVLIWLMIYPMMLKIDFRSILQAGKKPKGVVVTTVSNWLIKPYSMYLFASLCFLVLFTPWISYSLGKQYLAGAILLGAAPCTAMVFVWSYLANGDPAYTLIQVAINDAIILFAYAPIVMFLMGVSGIKIPYDTVILSVVLFVVVPFTAGYISRVYLLKRKGADWFENVFLRKLGNVTVVALLCTLVIIFIYQGKTIVENPWHIILIAVPLTINTYFIFAFSYGWAWLWRLDFAVAAPAGFIAASNFFELAVAVAISLFGLKSGATLATVVGVLEEVPIMLSLVWIAKRTKKYVDRRSAGLPVRDKEAAGDVA
ncbi:MAG: ACR3 family arsenite efflux transporter [Actinobacteria bacterium]|nr:ACR3 family arsenite efflux transporter [Actinomycetota bacterium]MBU1944885.1 ACR3 family arsenite efflux transporter [Actinomycetota bacterium]MBU2688089.1 ACR3 family arsenite efflux transporter [Actinomycetota bacterium]